MHSDELENPFIENKGKLSSETGAPGLPSPEVGNEMEDQPSPIHDDSISEQNPNGDQLIIGENFGWHRPGNNVEEREFVHPPEDYPDGSMGTPLEDIILAETIPPDRQDGGMSAGYPPLRDDYLLPEPAVPVVQPEPTSMRGAPLFSTISNDLKYPEFDNRNGNLATQNKDIPEKPDD